MKLCECGCGEPAPIAKRTNSCYGHVKGQPVRFVVGHGARGHKKTVGPDYIVTEAGCWEWQHQRLSDGYGVAWRDGRAVRAHVWFYEQAHGPIPDGLVTDHLCRNRACVNPDHLEPVTHVVNCWRGAGSKLTPEQAREIRASTDRGVDLARRYGISTTIICEIRKGRKWAAA